MNSYAREVVDKFLDGISRWEKTYVYPGLSFVAARSNSQLHLLQARLFLDAAPSNLPCRLFETPSIIVGYIPLVTLDLNCRSFIDRILSAEAIQTPIGEMVFPTEPDRGPSAYFMPFHQDGFESPRIS